MLTQKQQALILRALPGPVFVMTQSGCYVDMYGGLDNRNHRNAKSLLGKTIHDIFPKEKADRFVGYIQSALRDQNQLIVEYELDEEDVSRLAQGVSASGTRWFEARIQPLPESIQGEPTVLWVTRDITHHHSVEARLLRLSDTDDLTGLYNRRKFMNALAASFDDFQRYQCSTSVFLFDIDNFKEINDTLGHLAGDEAIKAVAEVCKRQARKTDLIARFGGDEFIILMEHVDLDQARQSADRLRTMIAKELATSSYGTISGGVSEMLTGDKFIIDVLKRADTALYEAKSLGRNRVQQA